MPLKTYYNLDQEKKDRVFRAGVLEFAYHSKNEASVNTIVRIANISKGSFYQYFKDKDDFYWFIVMDLVSGKRQQFTKILRENEGDIFKTEEILFYEFLTLFDDSKVKLLVTNVLRDNYLTLQSRLLQRTSTIYIDNYDLLIQFGFKGYTIKTKEDFLNAYEMLRSIQTHCIGKMITESLSKSETIELYNKQMEILKKGVLKRGFFQ